MKASELRIGNYVTIDNNENWEEIKHIPMVVISIKYKEEGNYSISVDMAFEEDLFYNGFSQYERFIEPIPLTEEWLLKFGYTKVKVKGEFVLFEKELCVYTIAFSSFANIFIKHTISLVTQLTAFQYVHQLQNLYYALTGEELNIKN